VATANYVMRSVCGKVTYELYVPDVPPSSSRLSLTCGERLSACGVAVEAAVLACGEGPSGRGVAIEAAALAAF
jgi:hypothetical protein